MVKEIYLKVLDFVKTKPIRLWAMSWLAILVIALGYILGGPVLLIGVVVSVLVSTSFLNICLLALKGGDFKMEDLFGLFNKKKAAHVLKGTFWMYLSILLWSLIPIAGIVIGIIRAYEYALVPFILVKEPRIAPKDAMAVSKARTNGHKLDMFLCDLIWVLAVLLVMFLCNLLGKIPVIGIIFTSVGFLINLLFLAVHKLVDSLLQASYYDYIPSAMEEWVSEVKADIPQDVEDIVVELLTEDAPEAAETTDIPEVSEVSDVPKIPEEKPKRTRKSAKKPADEQE